MRIIVTELSLEEKESMADGCAPDPYNRKYILIFDNRSEADAVKELLDRLLTQGE